MTKYYFRIKYSLKKWFFEEPWFERLFVEPEMVP